jgi:hypothetical protein
MFRLLLRAAAIAFVGFALAACASRPPQSQVPQIFDIRAATVMANEGVPSGVLKGIKSRLDLAIAATVRPVPLPRVVMAIRVVNVSKGLAPDGGRAQAEVSVVLADITSAHPVEVKNFLIYSFSASDRTSNDALAEAIAARLRFEYSLTIPQIRPRLVQPRLSTRMNFDRPVATEARPLVIPLRTAPVIGADQDPILNSKTNVDPATKIVVPDARPKPESAVPAENQIESGAKAKVIILPKKPSTPDTPPMPSDGNQPGSDPGYPAYAQRRQPTWIG